MRADARCAAACVAGFDRALCAAAVAVGLIAVIAAFRYAHQSVAAHCGREEESLGAGLLIDHDDVERVAHEAGTIRCEIGFLEADEVLRLERC